jgi:hypothetical protein
VITVAANVSCFDLIVKFVSLYEVGGSIWKRVPAANVLE